MRTTAQQIDLWLSAPSEHPRLEFKEAKTQFDNRKLYKYCVAIANEGGGHLVLGVSDAKPRKIVGSSAFNNPVAMASKVFQAIGFRVDIEEVEHSDGRVVVFHIPSRPRGSAYGFDGAYLMRVGEQLKPMSEDCLRERFRLSESSTNSVSQIITATLEAGLIKPDPNAPTSRKYARYLPIWA